MSEGQKAGPKGRQLEVGAQRAPRLLIVYIVNTYDLANIRGYSNPNAIFPARGFRSRALEADQASVGIQLAIPPFVGKIFHRKARISCSNEAM